MPGTSRSGSARPRAGPHDRLAGCAVSSCGCHGPSCAAERALRPHIRWQPDPAPEPEDFCQALGYPGEMKYESQGCARLGRRSTLIRRLGLGPAAAQDLLDWAVFNAGTDAANEGGIDLSKNQKPSCSPTAARPHQAREYRPFPGNRSRRCARDIRADRGLKVRYRPKAEIASIPISNLRNRLPR